MTTEADIKKSELENNPEYQAIMGLEGLKPKEQAGNGTPAVTTDPPKGEPPVAEKPQGNNEQVDQKAALLKEIFGERFASIEDAKNANITNALDEVEVLRRDKAELETKLGIKPKTAFANDEVALYNEFVKETGLKSYGLFQKINTLDVATMDPMEALVTKHIMDNPGLAGKEAQVKLYFERKYNVDPNSVDEEDLAINRIGMETDGVSAIKALQAIKDKLKLPEPVQEDKPKILSASEKAALQTGWSNVGAKVSESLAKLKVPIKNSKEPLLDYDISESEQKEIATFVAKYAVENQMELNENNVQMVSTMVYSQLMLNKLPEIAHSIFEKARSMTEQQVHALYENPSPARNTDRPSGIPDPKSDFERRHQAAFDAEMGR